MYAEVLSMSLSIESRPTGVLSRAHQLIQTDSPRKLKDHLLTVGEATLQSNEGAEFLGQACLFGSGGCVRVLLESGCNPDSTHRGDGMTCLHVAAQNGHTR